MAVRDHIPLEQGLRRNSALGDHLSGDRVRDHIPLEQGLRLLRRSLRMPSHIVRDHIPLEQGLRHVPLLLTEHSAIGVRDHIPLEQGLRHNPTLSRYCYHSCQRPYSIRTRIKTDVN